MAELADALDSGSSEGSFMQVQVLLPAPKIKSAPIRCCFYLRKIQRQGLNRKGHGVKKTLDKRF